MSGEPLRPKDLIPVIFTLDSEKAKVRGPVQHAGHVLLAVCYILYMGVGGFCGIIGMLSAGWEPPLVVPQPHYQ